MKGSCTYVGAKSVRSSDRKIEYNAHISDKQGFGPGPIDEAHAM